MFLMCSPCSALVVHINTQTMLLTRLCLLSYRWLAAALVILLLASSTVTLAHSTTVEHDFHIVHNVDNRSKLTFLYCMVLTRLCVSIGCMFIKTTLSKL